MTLGHWILGIQKPLSPEYIGMAFANAGSDLWFNIKAIFGPGHARWDGLIQFWHEIYLPCFLGALGPAIVISAIAYYVTIPLVEAYQKARAATAHERAERRGKMRAKLAEAAAKLKLRSEKGGETALNFEMAATDEMVGIALHVRPQASCLVPEKRSERTTEGGLDVISGHDRLKIITQELTGAGIRVSLFIEPSLAALDAAKSIGAPVVELHTGSWCDAIAHGQSDKANAEFGRIRVAAARAEELGIECHAGHGLDYDTARKIAGLPQIVELNIGHFLMGEAIFVGLTEAIRTMRHAMDEGRRGGV